MFRKIMIIVLFINATYGDGNDNLRLNQTLSKFNLQNNEGDDSDKIIFKDNNINSFPNSKVKFPKRISDQSQQDIQLKTNELEKLEKTNSLDFVFPEESNKILHDKDSTQKKPVKDVFSITFPDETNGDFGKKTANTTKTVICEYMTRSQCHRRIGYIYENKSSNVDMCGTELICCIGAVSKQKEISRISYPNSIINIRKIRSTNIKEVKPTLTQRNSILLRSDVYRIKNRIGSPPPKTTLRIVTPDDDYEDPYLNIKNSIFKTTPQGPFRTTTENYNGQDYPDHYLVELPRPGFLGLHTNGGRKSTSWTFDDDKKSYDEEEADGDKTESDEADSNEDTSDADFGYGSKTVDPRQVVKTSRRGSVKLTSKSTDEDSYDTKSQTISYHSNPDFKVLQGFKLLNLFRNRSGIFDRGDVKTTSPLRNDRDSHRRPLSGTSTEDNDNVFDTDDISQVYNECGKAVNDPIDHYENDKQVGESINGSHPWMAVIVLTKRPQTFLCYATVLHPRFAITAADCVDRRSSVSGDLTLIAGLWVLDDDTGSQQRKPSIHIHPKFKRGGLGHNIAMLFWKRPLKLGVNVQPACLTKPKIKSDCKFFGWGGYDQDIQAQSHWQRASILTTRQCNAELSSGNAKVELPVNEFCATVDSQTSVTGVGGSLICNQQGRASVAGVAVWRDKIIVLISVREWAVKTFEALNA